MIRIKELWKIYDTGKIKVPALKGVDLHIRAGEFAAIMGPSGSGKSTLMNILGCLDRPTKGAYQLDQKNVETMNDDALAEARNQKNWFCISII